jgi:hypothetical protein
MRYRLRTLLIVLALGPPQIAAFWWFSSSFGLYDGLTLCALPLLAMSVAFVASLTRTSVLRPEGE